MKRKTGLISIIVAFILGGLIALPVVSMAAPPVVKTVPWVATNPLIPHDTWSGKPITLKGTSDVQGGNIEFTWDFGDGSPVATGIVSNMYVIERSHTYSGAAGTVFTARLTVRNTTTGETGNKEYYVAIQPQALQVEVNRAIDEGLWSLHKSLRRADNYGYWEYNYYTEDPANLNAFFVNGHLETGAASNPYTETVQRGMRRLFMLLNATGISTQTYPAPIGTVNPDGNGNGLGIYSPETYTYSGGIFMDAIVASGTPDALTTTGPANVIGRKYRDIVQDMVDGYAYGQTDSGTWMGGWGYGWNYGSSDNSVNQWAAIGFLGAESWGITVPAFVKQANQNSVNNTQATTANCGASYDGAFAYTDNHCYFPWGPYGTTPAGMVQMVLDGIGRGDARWNRTENFIRNNFCNTGQSYEALRSYYYGLFSFTKAMLLYPGGGIQFLANQPGGANPIDWYAAEASAGAQCNGVARTLVNDQLATGDWGLHNAYGYHTYFSTAWAIIMLNRTVFESGNPVAVAEAIPNPGVVGQSITLDGSDSFHQDPAKSIVAWAWDLDNDGAFDDATGPVTSRSFPAVADYPVGLRVTDNVGDTDDTILTVRITLPPIAPTAEANGPYVFCPNATPWYLNGSGSTNPDDGQHEAGRPGDFIREYAWDLDGDGAFDDAFGPTPDATAILSAAGEGDHLIRLRVTDNTATSFPSSGMPDLTDTDSAQVSIKDALDPVCVCLDDLAARAKDGKVQLTWTHSGAHHYNVYRSLVSGGPYGLIGSTTSTYSTYLDATVVTGTTYYYVVRPAALNGDELCQSEQVSATPTARPRR